MNERRPFTCLGSRRQRCECIRRHLLTGYYRSAGVTPGIAKERARISERSWDFTLFNVGGGEQRRGGSNSVTRNGEDLGEEKSPGNIKLRHMVVDLAGPDWRMTGTCALCKSQAHIALTSISVHHGRGTSSNLPNPFGFSISSEQHERFTRCYCLLLAPRPSPFKVRFSRGTRLLSMSKIGAWLSRQISAVKSKKIKHTESLWNCSCPRVGRPVLFWPITLTRRSGEVIRQLRRGEQRPSNINAHDVSRTTAGWHAVNYWRSSATIHLKALMCTAGRWWGSGVIWDAARLSKTCRHRAEVSRNASYCQNRDLFHSFVSVGAFIFYFFYDNRGLTIT